MARIVLTTFGSLGDLNPMIALARALRGRGHEPVVAAMEFYRGRVEAAGIGFAPVRPDLPELGEEAEVLRRANHPTQGTAYVVRDLVLRHLRESYDDLGRAA